MIGFGVMTRPDMMADLLGAAGFFLACGLNRRWLPAAAVLLALGCLTKQTAGVWLLAAVLVLLCREGSRRLAFVLGRSGRRDRVGGRGVPGRDERAAHRVQPVQSKRDAARPDSNLGILLLLLHRSPEMLFFALVGCGLWMSQRAQRPTPC